MRIPGFSTFNIAMLCLVVGLCANAVAGTVTEWTETDQFRLRLISEYDGVKNRDSVRIGLQIKLAPGWKTYWRSPGDSGIPPRLDWSGSKNFKEANILWPLPELFDTYGLSSWGYHDEVVFPIDVALDMPGQPLDLKLRLQIGVCEEVCIPVEQELAFSLGSASAELSSEAPVIREFARRVPQEIGSTGAMLRDIAAFSGNGNIFTVSVRSDRSFKAPGIIVEGKDGSYFELLASKLSKDGRNADFKVKGYLPGKSDRMKEQIVTVTIFDDAVAGEKTLRVE